MTATWTAVRVEDASLVPAGGPARVAFSGLPRAEEIAAALGAEGDRSVMVHGRWEVMALPREIAAAADRVGGAAFADGFAARLDRAISDWLGGPPDLETPAGTLPCASRPVVMGVLNVTPDSFSDGGDAYDAASHPQRALAAGEALLEAGADVVDIGGESTRPGADPVSTQEELARVLPVVTGLARAGAVVSIDTTKAAVARRAVEAGAAIVNDISGGSLDAELLPAVAELDVPYVLSHIQGTPRTMQHAPSYQDVVAEVFDLFSRTMGDLGELGIGPERLVLDPGIGFGKRLEHNLALLRRLRGFTSLGRPVLIGTSRKSFISAITGGSDPLDRLEGSLVSASLAVANGAAIVRVHDVRATLRAVRVAHAITTPPSSGATASTDARRGPVGRS